jgi:hypothetical protein
VPNHEYQHQACAQSWSINVALALQQRVSNHPLRWGVFAIFVYATLIAVRIPNILLKGRFWAEEQAVYFAAARQQPWYDALFQVHTGYLNVTASIAGLAATIVPLEEAPLVSSTIALLIQLLPPLILITGQIPWLRRPWQMAAALLLLLTVQNTGEIWMNTITSQFHLALAVAIILAVPPRGGWIGVLHRVVLLLGPLSGPASSFLAPLFFLRALLDRSRARFIQACLLSGATLVQVIIALLYPEPARLFGIGPRMLALVVFGKHILMPALGPIRADLLANPIAAAVRSGTTPWLPIAVTIVVAIALAWSVWASRDAALRWLFAAGATIMTLSYFGALGDHLDLLSPTFGGRYAFAPSALFALVIFGLSQQPDRAWTRKIALAATIWAGLAGIIWYPIVRPMFSEGPAWRDEVARLRADPAHLPQSWPDMPIWKFPIGPAN